MAVIKVLALTIISDLDNLADREENVLRLLYGLDGEGERNYKEVSRVFNVSVNTIRNVEKERLTKYAKDLNYLLCISNIWCRLKGTH